MVQWLELQALTAGDVGSIPSQRTKTPQEKTEESLKDFLRR